MASAQNCVTPNSFCITLVGYYAASPLDPLLAEKIDLLPPELTPWLPATEIRLPSAGNSTFPLWSALPLRGPVSVALWTSFCPLSASYSPEIPSSRFSLPLYCKKSLQSIFPLENFSLQKIDFLDLLVCLPNDPQAPSYIFLLDNQQPRLNHNQMLRSFWLDPCLFLEVSPMIRLIPINILIFLSLDLGTPLKILIILIKSLLGGISQNAFGVLWNTCAQASLQNLRLRAHPMLPQINKN